MNRRTLFIGGAAALTASAAAASLLLPRKLPPALTYTRDGFAIGGTDPVAYFTHARPIGGDPAYTHDYAGATWRFISALSRDEFAGNPDAYAPRYGGFCAWAVAAKSALFSTQPDNWAIVNGKLYLNFSDEVQADWDKDRAGFIRQANLRWPRIVASL
ncbi:YHS domain-containing (seleno)protein [Jannaschia helgolandensis]|uniref:YHS domain-containing (seleno)protein n=1 Tax=Jannaschia helgolandensis TaxID=188906 RepID=UPI0030DA4A71|tara:strand:- start:1921 stop:2394 length:474 start_codon:yes stop_codon:yes gene_type:complete